MLRFSVVVPTYNRLSSLEQCLEALAAQDQPRDAYEVVVVDDGSKTSPRDLVARFAGSMQVRLIEQANAGPAAARNAGARAAQAPYLAFTDDDCRPSPGWLSALGAALDAHPRCAIGGPVVSILRNPCALASQFLVDFLYDYFGSLQSKKRFFVTANVAMPTDQFRAIGGFDQTFPFAAAEDRDLCERWQVSGYGLEEADTAVVMHAHPLFFKAFCRQHFMYGRGAWFLIQANRSRGQGGLKVPSLDFYWRLVTFPFSRSSWPHNVQIAALLVLSQVAYKVGFIWQLSAAMRGDASARAHKTA